MSDYNISKDGTIFNIQEDGSIQKLGKIENGRIISNTSNPSSNTTDSKKTVLIVFLVVFIIATIGLGIAYVTARDDANYYYSRYITVRDDLETATSELETAKSEIKELTYFKENVGRAIPMVISDISIANTYYNGNVETNYGSTIYSSRTMYLTPRITYSGFSTGNKTLYVKLITPSGVLSTGKTSPSGYSYSDSIYISSGQHTVSLTGWGNETKGNWPAGNYRIEVWYNNSCLKTKTFTIY